MKTNHQRGYRANGKKLAGKEFQQGGSKSQQFIMKASIVPNAIVLLTIYHIDGKMVLETSCPSFEKIYDTIKYIEIGAK